MSVWVVVSGYGRKYEVSRDGNVRNVVTGRTLVPSISKTGYLFVKMDRPDLPRKNALIHRLVAEAFIPNPQKKTQVNHRDGDKKNNCVENLEWVTPAENIRHSFAALGKQPPMRGKTGELNRNSIPVHQYDLGGNYIRSWGGVSDAARALNCNPAQILNQIAGRTVTCHGYLWSYDKADCIDNSRVRLRKTHKQWGL